MVLTSNNQPTSIGSREGWVCLRGELLLLGDWVITLGWEAEVRAGGAVGRIWEPGLGGLEPEELPEGTLEGNSMLRIFILSI